MKNLSVGAVWRLMGLSYFLGGAGGASGRSAGGLSVLSYVFFALLGLFLAWAILTLLGVHVDPVNGLEVIAGAATAPAAARPGVSFARKWEPTKNFQNVAAGADSTHPATAFTIVPNYPRTLLGIVLNLGGTAFVKADITRIEVFAGEKSIWGPVSGPDLDAVNRYVNGDNDQDVRFLPVMFTMSSIKEIGGEFIGGLDLTQLGGQAIRMEVDIASSATAPTLSGETCWGAPQGGGPFGGLMLKLIKRKYAQMNSGDNFPVVDLKGAIIARQFMFFTVKNAAVSTARGIGGGANTGNGVMGAITVSDQTPRGRYRLIVTVAAANAGTFAVFDPTGKLIDTGTVGVAFSSGGLAFTLADGATDFLAGDGFTIDVLPTSTDANLNLVEVKKNEDVWWSHSDRRASFLQKRYGRTPLSGLMVVDFVQDNHADSLMDTANPDGSQAQLDYKVNLTAADTITVIHQVLASPTAF